MKNTNWNLVKAGQIVQFQYQNIKGESSKRTKEIKITNIKKGIIWQR